MRAHETFFSKTADFVLDFLFPPSVEVLKLREISEETLFSVCPPAPILPFTYITSVFAYKNPLVSALIWNIKYKKDIHTVKLGGFALHKKLCEMNVDKSILVPIPISKKRRKERGYNQCELLINEILRLDHENKFEKNFHLLVRAKHTERQTLKNREERIEGVESVFSVGEMSIDKNANIIIIDDVTTTGSTVKEAREVLLQAGYQNIRVLTLAH